MSKNQVTLKVILMAKAIELPIAILVMTPCTWLINYWRGNIESSYPLSETLVSIILIAIVFYGFFGYMLVSIGFLYAIFRITKCSICILTSVFAFTLLYGLGSTYIYTKRVPNIDALLLVFTFSVFVTIFYTIFNFAFRKHSEFNPSPQIFD